MTTNDGQPDPRTSDQEQIARFDEIWQVLGKSAPEAAQKLYRAAEKEVRKR